jgi:hypothetical protein
MSATSTHGRHPTRQGSGFYGLPSRRANQHFFNLLAGFLGLGAKPIGVSPRDAALLVQLSGG